VAVTRRKRTLNNNGEYEKGGAPLESELSAQRGINWVEETLCVGTLHPWKEREKKGDGGRKGKRVFRQKKRKRKRGRPPLNGICV